MGRIARLVAVLLAIAATAGCAHVYKTGPMGKNPVPLSPQEWDGTWIALMEGNENAFLKPITVKVIDEKQGLLRAAAIEADNVGFTLHAATIHIRETDNTLFASRRENPASDRYLWGVLIKGPGKIFLSLPAVKKFHELVDEGALPGVLIPGEGETEDVLLEDLTEMHMDRIARDGDLFLMNYPFVYIRIIDQIGPAALAVAPKKADKPYEKAKIVDAEVRWAGIVVDDGSKEVLSPSGTKVLLDKPARLELATTKIPALPGTRFGIRYVLHGASAGGYAGIREVWRFPEPGLTNPKTGKTFHEQLNRAIAQVTDKEIFSGWALLYDWELVPEIWTFEVWTGDRLLLKQRFDVNHP
jgi:hypothetical protein